MNRLLLYVGLLHPFGVMLRLRVRHSVLRVLANFGLWRMRRLFFELFLLASRRFYMRDLFLRWGRYLGFLCMLDLSLLSSGLFLFSDCRRLPRWFLRAFQ